MSRGAFIRGEDVARFARWQFAAVGAEAACRHGRGVRDACDGLTALRADDAGGRRT